MKVITSIAEMQTLVMEARREQRSIALVPTMGYLHEGHASLLREGRKRADLLVVSIFVNPTQFGAGEDLDSYPRDLERDRNVAECAGVDIVFAPLSREMYPEGFQTYVNVEQLTQYLCGASRPGHFRGVATVVTKLLNIVQPQVALFGKKDFQQLAVIRRMVTDLNMPVEIVGMPIVRESDGLAMSSRNTYLSADERRSALTLRRALETCRRAYLQGEASVATLREMVVKAITMEQAAVIDYVDFRDSTNLTEVDMVSDTTLLALAVRIGNTRLIDNCVLGEEN